MHEPLTFAAQPQARGPYLQDAETRLVARLYLGGALEAAPAVKRYTARSGDHYVRTVTEVDARMRQVPHSLRKIHLLFKAGDNRAAATLARALWPDYGVHTHMAVGVTILDRATGFQCWIFRDRHFTAQFQPTV